ncbi:MAG: thioredoxin domain-containing protein [Deltaproteobacteria bacterium]|nr:thioredoxin domain-containing protein [Deltaproteobacteria bacterium]
MLKEYSGKVRLVIKHYPYRYRDFAFISAEAALAARDQGKFREMHNMLNEHSPDLDRDSLLRYARELSLDMGRFTRDLDTMRHKKEIDRDVKLAEELDLYNTPTFYINGIRLQGNRPFEQFQEIIDRELGQSVKK